MARTKTIKPYYISIGYTGTRQGMTESQLLALTTFFHDNNIHEAHHGDCIGGDEQFHEICREFGVDVVLHPPIDDRLRAFCVGAVRTMLPRPYLERNHIIDTTELLLAAPKEDTEPLPGRGQGTWSTVRYARRSRKPFRIVWPMGVAW